jgi:hypothetical protein
VTDPIALAGAWLEAAREAGVPQPEAMAIASSDERGRPSVRMVLMRGLDADGFRFYTNRESRKARELDANPHGALVFDWIELRRQVVVTGTVERVGERQALLRLTAPVPGMLSVFTFGEGDGKATAGVRAYLFSADAADYVRQEEPAWQDWLQGLAVPA